MARINHSSPFTLHLVTDTGCQLCTHLADRVAEHSGGRIVLHGIDDATLPEQVRQHLQRRSEPLLFDYRTDGEVRTYANLRMRVKLIRCLGVRATIALLKDVFASQTHARHDEPVSSDEKKPLLGRRSFLGTGTSFAAVGVLIGLRPSSAMRSHGSSERAAVHELTGSAATAVLARAQASGATTAMQSRLTRAGYRNLNWSAARVWEYAGSGSAHASTTTWAFIPGPGESALFWHSASADKSRPETAIAFLPRSRHLAWATWNSEHGRVDINTDRTLSSEDVAGFGAMVNRQASPDVPPLLCCVPCIASCMYLTHSPYYICCGSCSYACFGLIGGIERRCC